jgi:hypothetical protein
MVRWGTHVFKHQRGMQLLWCARVNSSHIRGVEEVEGGGGGEAVCRGK